LLTVYQQLSFGMAPSAAAFALGLRTPVDHFLLCFFVLCGLSRLARFNVTVSALPKDATGKSKYFEGTPIPTSLALVGVMSYMAWNRWLLEDLPLGTALEGTALEFHPFALVFVIHGSFMISRTIKIPKP
jgi:CDP-diacylglycerol---serine O-phosphatidyltransferase